MIKNLQEKNQININNIKKKNLKNIKKKSLMITNFYKKMKKNQNG